VNPDTGSRVEVAHGWRTTADFRKTRLSEVIGNAGEPEEDTDLKPRRALYSPLWQADGKRIRRVAPLEFIGRYMDQSVCGTESGTAAHRAASTR
jgi:hypothetical protein